MPLIDDHAAIARRMRELQLERTTEIAMSPEMSAAIQAEILALIRRNFTVEYMIEAAREAKRQRQQQQQPTSSAELRDFIDRARATRLPTNQERLKQLRGRSI